MPRRTSQAVTNQVSLGAIVREELPFPIVFYPNLYGTFVAFAKDKSSTIYLCACSEPAVKNLLRLQAAVGCQPNSYELRNAPLDSWFFPNELAKVSLNHKENSLKALSFQTGLCHRCNLATPSLRWCHEMYGGEFVQHFGWYINQTYLRLGILPMSFDFLPDVCPPELQQMIQEMKRANEEYDKERLRLQAISFGPKRLDIPDTEVTYWSNVKLEEAQEMISLRKAASRANRLVKNTLENITRKEFGHRKVGEGWVSETLLYQILKRLFPSEEIVRHHRPEWLEGLELDIYFPNLEVAIEYQGQQHCHPIEAWGGYDALQALKERDARKAKICKERGIHLITVDYTEPLTEEHISELFKDTQLSERTAYNNG